jgi:hypothetical protein
MSRRVRKASASAILRPALTAAGLDSLPVWSSKVVTSIAAAASPIAICATSDSASLVTPRLSTGERGARNIEGAVAERDGDRQLRIGNQKRVY